MYTQDNKLKCRRNMNQNPSPVQPSPQPQPPQKDQKSSAWPVIRIILIIMGIPILGIIAAMILIAVNQARH